MNVFVRASIKSHIPEPQFCDVCLSTPNRICLTLYDVINYNDVTLTLSSYEYGRNLTFTSVICHYYVA